MRNKLTLVLFIIILLLLCMFVSITALAEDSYTYIDENGDAQTTEGVTVTPVTAEMATLNSGWYVVNSDVTRTSTITVSGDVKLILVDGFTLSVTGNSNSAGISVLSGNSLTVYGQAGGTGKVIAQGGYYGAGIGGGYNVNPGTTTISGGTVVATGGTNGAGIGGGYSNVVNRDYGSGGTIIITGGNITANGNERSAGIGGGTGSSGTISISGGTINATSGDVSAATGGAGIGGGAGKGVIKITISGGTVVANALDYGAGIGGGSSGGGGIIEISGGSVQATSRYRGSGIGGGNQGGGGTTTISGGTVTATSQYGGPGIGGGYLAPGGTINIQGGDITASGGLWGAGIGSGGEFNAGNITISGGVVKAYGGDYGAGIGAGGTNTADSHNGGTVKILGGKVTARGGASDMDAGLDIGRGRHGVNGTLLIDETAQVTLAANGIDMSATTLGTCILQGSAAGSLSGAYENGTKIDGTLIDLSNPALSGGTGYTVSGNTVTLTVSGNSFVLFGSTDSRNVVISSGSTANVALFAADIQPASGCAFNMDGATVSMRLVENNTLTSGTGCAGLQIPAGSTLAISGSGSLTATGGNNGAGIGGGSGMAAGSITFSSGTVSAVGNGGGAGIGGGSVGAGGTVIADGENTAITATGGNGFDIGSGSGNSTGGSLTMQNGAAVIMDLNGTNASTSFIAGTVSGNGSGLMAGTYLDSHKLLLLSSLTASPESDVKALDSVTLTAAVTGLSATNPQGQIAFYDNGAKIGQASLTRAADGSPDATADFVWLAQGGTHTLTAQYVQNETLDSYYMTDTGRLENYGVAKIEQASLGISGIPGTVTYGGASFVLSVSGGSGTGAGLSFSVTSGEAVSVGFDGTVSIEKAGTADVTVTKDGDTNHLPVSAAVTITVNKATPPAVVFPTASVITYEQELSASALTGGSGDGSFAWENPDTVPTVINSGYNVVFTPRDTDNYDYTGFVLAQNVNIHVNKATPLVTFPAADEITYEQPLSDSVLTGGSGDGSFAWESPTTIPTVLNSGYRVIFTPNDTDNYESVSQLVSISVQKAQQSVITVSGIPSIVTYGDASFDLTGSGGSSTGGFSYAVTSGDAVSVSIGGTATVLKAGTAQITAVKAGDSNYLPVSVEAEVTVNKAIPAAAFPNAGNVTYEQPLSASVLTGGSGDGSFAWESPDTIPTVINSGYNVVFTPSDTGNYLTIQETVPLIVNNAAQTPLTLSGIPDKITFGDAPFKLKVSGGTAEAALSYAVVSGNAVSVDSSGNVTAAHGGTAAVTVTNPGDSNYLPVSKTAIIVVNKAVQSAALSLIMPDSVVYGAAPFRIDTSGGSGSGAFSYSLTSGNAVSIDASGIVTVTRPGSASILVSKAADGDYLSQEKQVEINVEKGTQTSLTITGIPQRLTSKLAPFALIVNGGSGTGCISYAVKKGNAVSVDTNGIVTIVKPGMAVLEIVKAADDYYNAITATVEIKIEKAAAATSAEATPPAEDVEPSPSPLGSPKPSPAALVTPSPTVISSSPPSEIKPLSIQADDSTGTIAATINIDDLPEGTTSIQLPSGQIVQIDTAQKTIQIQISQADLNENGELEFIALDEENIPLGNYQIELPNEALPDDIREDGSALFSTLIWAAAAALILGTAAIVSVKLISKKNRR